MDQMRGPNHLTGGGKFGVKGETREEHLPEG
jgi:hypothetical protein